MRRKKAFVTGASRGIGKAVAIRLAQGGYDVAITARTVEEGESREHSNTVKKSDTTPIPGSLSSTADLMRAAGSEVMVLPADLLDRGSLGAAAATVLERWGGVDLVVHNGRFIGPGHMDLITDTPIEILEKHVEGNAFAPLLLNRMFLPAMLKQGSGTIVYITSAAAYNAPPDKAGHGGWGLSYTLSKAAGHSMAMMLVAECAHQGIRSFNVQPGPIKTERIAQDMKEFGFDAATDLWQPPEVIGEAVYWPATSSEQTSSTASASRGRICALSAISCPAGRQKIRRADKPSIHPSSKNPRSGQANRRFGLKGIGQANFLGVACSTTLTTRAPV